MLENFFNPKSIAVIGASRDPQKVGYSILNNLHRFGYRGSIFPVNPRASEILGMKAYPKVTGVPSDIDLAVIVIPSQFVLDELTECANKGIGSVIIISAGFKETGGEGTALEQKLKERANELGIRILGPNCLGIINTSANMNATFAAGMLPKGRIAFFSQSGALGIAVLDWAIGNRIGFSKFISLGNKADLTEIDFIEYLSMDPETSVILGYIESVEDGKRFLDVVSKATRIKPIIMVKSGGTAAGARAASSHTGALSGSEGIFNAAFRQVGIIHANGIEELFELAKAFSTLPLPKGNRLAIVTNAGGPGILAADASEKSGITLSSFTLETINDLRAILPKNASLYNPIDIIGDATSERYRVALQRVVKDPNVDGLLVILTPQAVINVEETAIEVISAFSIDSKPILAVFMGEESVRRGVEVLKENHIPNFSYPEPAVRSFKKMAEYYDWKNRPEEVIPEFNVDRETVKGILKGARERGQYILEEMDVRKILECYGFNFPVSLLATTSKEAIKAADGIGYPVVMKVSSSDILHKTDVGGVKIGLKTPEAVEDAFFEITTNAKKFMPGVYIRGVSVSEMVAGGKEFIIGISVDPNFGHVIMFGLGGIYVEILKDVSFRIAPLSRRDASEMIREIRSYPLLKGVRGEKPVDVNSIEEGVLRISQLVVEFPDIIELDINPLIVKQEGEGSVILDARIILEGGS
ncbi:MAG: acetate--CoA ligase alpha subunit [Nitrospirota bacterium]